MIASIFQPECWMHSSLALVDDSRSTLKPDVLLVLDDAKSTKFFAHRFVLAYHSGYFRTLFTTYNAFEVHVSNVDPAIFSTLLAFMYTGQLHIDAHNVYDLLTASNFLYILSIAELCREYLREHQPVENARTTSVIKPVPRKNAISLSTVASRQLTETLKYQPLRINENDPSSIFKPVAKLPSSSPENVDKNATGRCDSHQQTAADSTKTSSVNKIVYDVACCDGPIKFRKVVNQFYKPGKTNETCEPSHSAVVACHDSKIVAKKHHSRPSRKIANVASFLFQEKGDGNTDNDTISNNSETKLSDHSQGNGESGSGKDDLDVIRNVNKSDVQYYPCKSCGSKFPSYYFVNKHRKLCHSNEGGESTIDD